MRSSSKSLLLTLSAIVAAGSLLNVVEAAPFTVPAQSNAIHLPLQRRAVQPFHGLEGDALLEWTENHRAYIRQKYASKLKASQKGEEKRKREWQRRRLDRRESVTSASLVNYEQDSSFFTSVSIGTPGSSVNMVLDTGSSDMWTVAGRESWNPAQSSTFQNTSTPFSITYGSGEVTGTLATDTVTLASQTAKSQTFALASSVSQGLLGMDLAGIMGFAFKSLSTSGSTPFWQNAGADIFSFYLRSASLSSQSGTELPGGTLTLGGMNGSQFTGDINWSGVIDESYWLITLGGITSLGNNVDLSDMNKVAVDTGTTLIGGPDDVVAAIYDNIEGSQRMSSGYYTFPCDTDGINATMHFGNQQYILTSKQLIAGTTDRAGTTCLGAFFSFGSTSDDELQYILGDAFLKNVYTIFDNSQSSGARVGFATLAEGLGATNVSRTVSQVATASGAVSAAAARTSILSVFVLSLASTFALLV